MCTYTCMCVHTPQWFIMQVYRRLQKLLLCLSHTQTLTTLDRLGENYDESVLKWKTNLIDSMLVCMYVYTSVLINVLAFFLGA